MKLTVLLDSPEDRPHARCLRANADVVVQSWEQTNRGFFRNFQRVFREASRVIKASLPVATTTREARGFTENNEQSRAVEGDAVATRRPRQHAL